MAALVVRHLFNKTNQQFFNKTPITVRLFDDGTIKRNFGTKNHELNSNKNIQTGQQIDSLAESLASKGYLRSLKSYNPPANVAATINEIVKSVNVQANSGAQLNAHNKYAILNECYCKFQHSIPNSLLHEINNIDEIIAFYKKPVNTTLPLDAMKSMELPSNLHIQSEYVRFQPETNAMFNGQTAFPKSSTIVTGLKARKKYKGFEVKRSWP